MLELMTADGYAGARWLVSRGIALVYVVAFLNILGQWRALVGERGLLPVPAFTARVDARRTPSLFHRWYSDRLAVILATVGVVLAAALVVGLPQQGPWWLPGVAFAVLWIFYLSYVNVGQIWYAFGWESILLDAGAIAVVLGSDAVAPPWPAILMARWLVFRIEFGAGLIKLRGDRCWRDLTCLDFHHETQPLPGPLSRRFHRLPTWMHRVETGANHVVQLGVPFALFLPHPYSSAAAVAIVITQAWLMVSGNFAWLNLITIVLATSAIGDAWLGWLPVDVGGMRPDEALAVIASAAFVATAVASVKPVRNMRSRDQRMNASFNPFHLVGTYGAFGSVTRIRYEVEIEATRDPEGAPDRRWEPYVFRGKPGPVGRRPRQVAPYHLRLDWLMWFLAMSPSPGRHRVWFERLVDALLAADPRILALLADDPMRGERPEAVRARRYRYRYAGRSARRDGAWWERELVGEFLAPTSAPLSTRGTR